MLPKKRQAALVVVAISEVTNGTLRQRCVRKYVSDPERPTCASPETPTQTLPPMRHTSSADVASAQTTILTMKRYRNTGVKMGRTPVIAKEALQNLSSINKPIPISFKDMQILMYQCKDFETPDGSIKRSLDEPTNTKINPWTVLTGILPGTKWCGNGDLAENYFDLGYLADVDKCCRAHDICPVKVRGFQNRYDLINYSFYTKSHCDCDTTFYQCLKSHKHPTANLMGTIYFNLLRVPCIEDVQSTTTSFDEKSESQPRRQFRNPLHVY